MTPKEQAAQQALEALELIVVCHKNPESISYGQQQQQIHKQAETTIIALREALESDVEDKDTAYMLGFSDGKQYAHKHEQHVQEGKCSDHPDAPHGFDRNASHNADRYVCECESWSPNDMAYRPGGLSMEQEPLYISQACAERGCACHYSVEVDGEPVAVYTAPQPMKEVSSVQGTQELTDDEIENIAGFKRGGTMVDFARAVIAADREKNR